ncbi:MAG: RNA polymerase sigma factor [Bacteroidales bacterium]|nr:RNA polymerase sigma factor [Bacteroidales bacterium]
MNYSGDEELVRQVCKGDHQSFAHLVERHGAMILNIAWRITGSQTEAEDVAQEVFIKAFMAIKKFKGTASFSSWLYRIAYNTSISHIRKMKSIFIIPEMVTPDRCLTIPASLCEPDEKSERDEAVKAALAGLGPEDRGLITMFYYGSLSIEKISDITGLSESNVKVRLFRVRKKLHDSLKSLIYETT